MVLIVSGLVWNKKTNIYIYIWVRLGWLAVELVRKHFVLRVLLFHIRRQSIQKDAQGSISFLGFELTDLHRKSFENVLFLRMAFMYIISKVRRKDVQGSISHLRVRLNWLALELVRSTLVSSSCMEMSCEGAIKQNMLELRRKHAWKCLVRVP